MGTAGDVVEEVLDKHVDREVGHRTGLRRGKSRGVTDGEHVEEAVGQECARIDLDMIELVAQARSATKSAPMFSGTVTSRSKGMARSSNETSRPPSSTRST